MPTSLGSTYTPGKVGSLSTYVHLRQDPICFIADTDSVSYTVDTAANHIIATDAGMLTDLKICSSNIKGVGGKGVQITGTGKLLLPLTSDSGDTDIISGLDAVLVPTCQYNLIPPQMLIEQMKLKGYAIKYFLMMRNIIGFATHLPVIKINFHSNYSH